MEIVKLGVRQSGHKDFKGPLTISMEICLSSKINNDFILKIRITTKICAQKSVFLFSTLFFLKMHSGLIFFFFFL